MVVQTGILPRGLDMDETYGGRRTESKRETPAGRRRGLMPALKTVGPWSGGAPTPVPLPALESSRFMGSLHPRQRMYWDGGPRSADFQSAVSPVVSILRSRATAEDGRSSTAEGGRVFNPQAPRMTDVPGSVNALAQTNALPTESRRYSRLKTCATKARFMGRLERGAGLPRA